LSKSKSKNKPRLKGEMLRDLIFLVYLNNKYGKGKNKISELEEIIGYSSPGGIYHALDNSGYFERNCDEIKLTELGKLFLNKEILKEHHLTKTIGNTLIIIALVLLYQWVMFTYFNHVAIISLYGVLPLLIGGLIIRFFMLRINYWLIRKQKQMV